MLKDASASSSNVIIAALIAEQQETPALCAHAASSIVCAGTSCSRAAIAAAFDDLASTEAVSDVLRGKP
jgi:hypothetical protein